MYDVLTVYHGGSHIIREPRVDIGRPQLDFGPGFYVTDIHAQAVSWARRVACEREALPVVNTYRLRQREFLTAGRCKVFVAYDREWLEFVASIRLGNHPWAGYDYIEGGVADDRVVNTVRLFMSGFISAEDALQRLQYFKPANQICILNQRLLDEYLTFVESENIEDYE